MRWENLLADVDNGTLCNSAGGCTLSVTNSTFKSNKGDLAGAVSVDARQSAVTIAASTFHDNLALVCNVQSAGLPDQTQ